MKTLMAIAKTIPTGDSEQNPFLRERTLSYIEETKREMAQALGLELYERGLLTVEEDKISLGYTNSAVRIVLKLNVRNYQTIDVPEEAQNE